MAQNGTCAQQAQVAETVQKHTAPGESQFQNHIFSASALDVKTRELHIVTKFPDFFSQLISN